MLGPIEDLIMREKNKDYETLELIHRNALRLLKLVNSLLDFSRIEAGRMDASFQRVNVTVVTRNLTSVFRSACERAGNYFLM